MPGICRCSWRCAQECTSHLHMYLDMSLGMYQRLCMHWTRSTKSTWTFTRNLLATMCLEMCLEVYLALSMHCPCAGHDVLGDERRSALRSVPEMALYHILCFRARAFAHAPLVSGVRLASASEPQPGTQFQASLQAPSSRLPPPWIETSPPLPGPLF